jgi:acylphosphatase
MKNLKIRIYGFVQGIGFRYEAKREADGLGLAGFARNQKDGSVYIEAEGEEEGAKKFLHWCKTGPAAADIKDIKTEFSNEIRNYKSFTIE